MASLYPTISAPLARPKVCRLPSRFATSSLARPLQQPSHPRGLQTSAPASSITSGETEEVGQRKTAVEPQSRDLANYAGPLRGTFHRLKFFSLGSLGLASALTPLLLLAPGEISMAGRAGLAFTAMATSGTSTALIAWIAGPYVGEMKLTKAEGAAGREPAARSDVTLGNERTGEEPRHVLVAKTTNWRLRPLRTTIHEPSFLRSTSRPFATWELANQPPRPSQKSDALIEAEAPRVLVSETVDVKSGEVIGRWWARWDTPTSDKGGVNIQGRCEIEGKPVRYFNVHEELLGDEWRVLG
ncbi:hypothetical protein IE53DRAFT_384483 [Violaceomyces palustris]|uniref:Uncharacterized protein n=1 Tax=Violaceomyces palustris TaxID=1673888 RepID=A0ACD0P4I7_9BASI|nr:hypothetical protein IE53DRAFT_384483 [Violaceomyces palustris]